MAGHELPPVLTGNEQQQLVAMRDFLVRLVQGLDQAASPATTVTVGNAAARNTGKGAGASVRADAATVQDLKDQASQLRSLIIKTANNVQQYVDDGFVTTTWAVDDGPQGFYQKALKSQVLDSVDGVLEEYDFASIVSAIIDPEQIQSFMNVVNGQIRRGYIPDPDPDHPDPAAIDGYIFGICISQDVEFYGIDQAVELNGQIYYKIYEEKTFGLYTAKGWQFWINGNKVGWFDSSSNDHALHVASAAIENHIQVGTKWLIDITDGGEEIGFRYIGG